MEVTLVFLTVIKPPPSIPDLLTRISDAVHDNCRLDHFHTLLTEVDPKFSVEGTPNLQDERQNTNLQIFLRNYIKRRKFWSGEGASPARSANDLTIPLNLKSLFLLSFISKYSPQYFIGFDMVRFQCLKFSLL